MQLVLHCVVWHNVGRAHRPLTQLTAGRWIWSEGARGKRERDTRICAYARSRINYNVITVHRIPFGVAIMLQFCAIQFLLRAERYSREGGRTINVSRS